MRAETLKFQEKGVRDIIKEVFLPWFNAYRFFTEAVRKYNGVRDTLLFISISLPLSLYLLIVSKIYKYIRIVNCYLIFCLCSSLQQQPGVQPFAPSTALALKSNNVMDKWIMAATTSLIKFVRGEMEGKQSISTLILLS